LVLGLATPKINELKDKAIIEQGIEMLNSVNSIIDNIKYVSGNSRPADVKIQKGTLIIDSKGDQIEYLIEESRYQYSELDKEIEVGFIEVKTIKVGKTYTVSLKLDYSNSADITWQTENKLKVFQPSSQPYSISITNKGNINDIPNIDFS